MRELEVVNGKFFVGFGGINANTGPINVRYFDPMSETLSGTLITVLKS